MHIETLRKHRKSLIKARREIKAKLELLDTLLEEAAGTRQEAAEMLADIVGACAPVETPFMHVVSEPTAATDADDIDADAEDLIATWCPPTEAEWNAAKAYQTAARNAYRNVMRAVNLDDPVYSKTDMERQRAPAPPDGFFLALAPYATAEASS